MKISPKRVMLLCRVRKLILPLVFFIIASSTLRAQLREVYRGSDANDNINGMSFISPSTGFVAFNKFVGFTQDSGHSYVQRPITTSNVNYNGYLVGLTFGFTPTGVVAFSKDSLLAYGDFSFEPSILFSADQGQTWKLVFHRDLNASAPVLSEGITDIEFPGNGSTGFALHHEEVLRSTDRGQTWTTVLNAPSQFLRKLSFPVATIGYVSGGNEVLVTTNTGASWTNITPTANSDNNFNNIFFVSPTTGYTTENTRLQIYKTTNGGSSWNKMNDESLVPAGGSDLWFINDSTGYIADGSYNVSKTTNSGKNWEVCKKTIAYQYLFYGMKALYFLDPLTGWAGGQGEYLLITTGGATPTWPVALGKADTTGLDATGYVQLVNYSNPGYQYKWYKNDTLLSTAYNSSYPHDNIYKLRDTIKLVVSNGADSDSVTLYVNFYPPVIITSFSPTVGTTGTQVLVNGPDFTGLTGVSFGGVPAAYTLYKINQITTNVGAGASGDVLVTTTYGKGKLAGFVYVPPPIIDLPVQMTDSILCKSEPVQLTISNTENNVTYELVDSLGNSFGFGTGNGGQLVFSSQPVSVTGHYTIRATKTASGLTVPRNFNTQLFILVEHTKSIFGASRVNAAVGEKIDFFNYSVDAQSYAWKLYNSPNQSNYTSLAPKNVYYSTAGQKALLLISTSAHGCVDSLQVNTVYIYNKPSPSDACYANPIVDSAYGGLSDMAPDIHDGYVVSGSGSSILLKSGYGLSKQINQVASYCARYTTDGVLSWYAWMYGGGINSVAVDKDGSIYLTGLCSSGGMFHLGNGDTLRFFVTQAERDYLAYKDNGFVVKLDSNGNYLWHTILYDPSNVYGGYPTQGGNGTKIRVQGDRVLVTGTFLANLSYYRNDTLTSLYALTNSTYPNDLQNNFILGIKNDGSLLWNSYIHNTATNQMHDLADIAVDSAGNSYIAGYYENNITIHDVRDSTTFLNGYVTDHNAEHGVLLKYDPQGRLLWTAHLDNLNSYMRMFLGGLALDASGNCYVAGATTLDNASQSFSIVNANGSSTSASFSPYFLAKFNPAGDVVWTQGSRYTGAGGEVYKLWVDGADLYASGNMFGGPLTMTSTGGDVNNVVVNEPEAFIARYDTSGMLKRINSSGTTSGGHLYIRRIFDDSKKNIIIAGDNDLDNGSNNQPKIFGSTITTIGSDAYYAKLSPGLCTPDTSVVADAGADSAICKGDSVTLGQTSNGSNYSWSSSPVGFTSTLAHPVVKPAVNTTYYLAILNPSGLITRDSVLLIVNTPNADAGPDKVSCNGAVDTIGTIASGDTYMWTSSPAGFTSMQANPTVTPVVNTSYYLSVKNIQGCTARDTVLVKVSSVSTYAGADTSICIGQVVTLGRADTTKGASWAWLSQPAGFSDVIANPVIHPIASTAYYITKRDSLGCTALDTVLVSTRPLPPKPSISRNATSDLVSSATAGNQWYMDTTNSISGATGQTYRPIANAIYTVQVTDSTGCRSPFSDRYNYIITAIIEIGPSGGHISFYPNPARDYMVFTYEIPGVPRLHINVIDAGGSVVLIQKNMLSGDKLPVSQLPQGLYTILIYDDKNKVHVVSTFIKL